MLRPRSILMPLITSLIAPRSGGLRRASSASCSTILAEAAQGGTYEEQSHHDLAAVKIAELAINRTDDRRRQHISHDDPGQVIPKSPNSPTMVGSVVATMI
jgi:hypothetical protein